MINTELNKWNAIYRHTEDGKWVMRIGGGFASKHEAQQYISESLDEHLSLVKHNDVLRDTQYKPW